MKCDKCGKEFYGKSYSAHRSHCLTNRSSGMKGRTGAFKNQHHNSETLKIISNAAIKSWKNPDVAKKRFRKKEKNFSEIFLDYIIQTTCPKEYEYTGTGKVLIDGKCPDWFNVNGKKQVIEYFSNYYHGFKIKGRTKEQEEQQRKDHFSKYGYDCLIIWEHELKEPWSTSEKIKTFSLGRIYEGDSPIK